MKILEFKRNISVKNKILIGLAIAFILIIGVSILIYSLNENARKWIDLYILRREITEDNIATISLDADNNNYIYAYDRYISILQNGKLSIYNGYANKEEELDIAISNPIYDASLNYLAIAEKNGDKICLISNTKELWECKIDGNISKISVNRNGYVSVITVGAGYKSIITVFDRSGKELFKRYLGLSIAVDTDISINNQYLAIAEVNTGSSIIESGINIIDMENAIKGEGESSVVFKHNGESNQIIIDIKYQERGELVCMYDDSIHIINDDKDQEVIKFVSGTKVADINLKSNILRIEEITKNLFGAETNVILKGTSQGAEATYKVESAVKECVCNNEIIAINLGTEIHFINLNGWLEKKYISNQESKEITIGTSVAGIVYRDRIKVLTF